MSKFRKIAGTPIKWPTNIGDFTKMLTSPGDDLTDLLNKENIKQNLVFLASLLPGWTDRYSPSAFYHALETDAPRGYGGTKHSQGAYEEISPALMKAIQDFKKNPPKNLKDLVTEKPIDKIENINVPESSDRYKAMREKLYPSSTTSTPTSPSSSATSTTTSTANNNAKFVKTSQRARAEDLQKVLPRWTIEDVIRDMAKFAARTDLNDNEKRQGMVNILNQYEKSIAPLSNFLDKNGIQYK
jgi:hypothetical protein